MDLGPCPSCFGDQVIGGLLIKNKRNIRAEYDDDIIDDMFRDELSEIAKSTIALYDRGAKCIDCFPKATRSAEHMVEAMQEFTKPIDKVKQFNCDNGGELEVASRTMAWRRPTSTPGRPQTNGVAERCVRKVKEDGTAGIVQSGLKAKRWWQFAVRHGCF